MRGVIITTIITGAPETNQRLRLHTVTVRIRTKSSHTSVCTVPFLSRCLRGWLLYISPRLILTLGKQVAQ